MQTPGLAESKPESRIEYLPATRRGGGEDRRSDEAEDHDRGAESVENRVVQVKHPGLGRDQEVEPERENLYRGWTLDVLSDTVFFADARVTPLPRGPASVGGGGEHAPRPQDGQGGPGGDRNESL